MQAVAPARLVGRGHELAAIRRHLDEGARVIALVGMGGIGKSALAAAVAHEARLSGRPALRCALEGAEALDALPDRLAAALDITPGGETLPERAARVGRALARLRAPLVVLDGFEGLPAGGVDLVRSWLERAPEARFLICSRVWVSLSIDVRLALGPLSCAPEDGTSPAATLFWMRAGLTRAAPRTATDEAEVEAIVRRLDGIPLAIELAAARLAIFDPATLRRRIDESGAMLSDPTRSTPDRHRALADVIGWSWRLLPPWARAGLGQLAVFRGPFALDDAEAVLAVDGASAADVLQHLCASSLLVSAPEQPGGAVGHRLLAPVRDAVMGLRGADFDAGAVARRYARWLLDGVVADDLAAVFDLRDEWLGFVLRRRAEYAALADGALDPLIRLRATLRQAADPWLGEARRRMASALDAALGALPEDGSPSGWRARFAGQVALAIAGVAISAPALTERARAQAHRLAEGHPAADVRAAVAYVDGLGAWVEARFGAARSAFDAAWRLAGEAGMPALEAQVGYMLTSVAEGEAARRIGRRTLALARALGSATAFAQTASALATRLDRPEEQGEQIALLEEALACDRRFVPEGLYCVPLHRLGLARLLRGELPAAEAALRRGLEWSAARQLSFAASGLAGGMGFVQLTRQDADGALAWFDRAAADAVGAFAQVWRACAALIRAERGEPGALAGLGDDLPPAADPAFDVRGPLVAWAEVVRHRIEPGASPPERLPPALAVDGQPVATSVTLLRRAGQLAWARAHPPADALLVAPSDLRIPGHGWRSMGRSRIGRAMVHALVHARLHAPGEPIGGAALVARVWPEERAPDSDSSRNRLHVGLHRARALGLKPWLRRDDVGWWIDPALAVLRVPGPR